MFEKSRIIKEIQFSFILKKRSIKTFVFLTWLWLQGTSGRRDLRPGSPTWSLVFQQSWNLPKVLPSRSWFRPLQTACQCKPLGHRQKGEMQTALPVFHLLHRHLLVNFTNILRAAFALIAFHQKITNANCKHMQKTLMYRNAARKMLVKLPPSFKNLSGLNFSGSGKYAGLWWMA